MANKRITETTLPSNFADGQILYGSDINKIVTVLREGVNSNKVDLDKILSGETSAYIKYSLAELNSLKDTTTILSGARGYVYNQELLGDGILYYDFDTSTNSWVYNNHLSLIGLLELVDNLGSQLDNFDQIQISVDAPTNPNIKLWLSVTSETSIIYSVLSGGTFLEVPLDILIAGTFDLKPDDIILGGNY